MAAGDTGGTHESEFNMRCDMCELWLLWVFSSSSLLKNEL